MNNTKNVWVGVIIVVFVIGAYYFIKMSKDSAQPTENIQNNPTDITTQENPITKQNENVKITPTSIDLADLNNGWQVVTIGSEKITKDGNDFSVKISDLGQTIGSNSIWAFGRIKTTQGKFIQVDFTINNKGLESEFLSFVESHVFDQDGRAYFTETAINVCDSNSTTDITSSSQQLKPNIPCTIKALYEVSQDSTSFTAKLLYKKES